MNHLIDNESRDSHHSCHNNENEKCLSPLLYENDDISCVHISILKTPEPLVCAMACVCAPYPTHILLSLIISIT